ncbi:hypothetical protein HGM15179_020972, partial [Zosterops borbonicus]
CPQVPLGCPRCPYSVPSVPTGSPSDATLKLWNLHKPLGPRKSAALDVEPVYAFRGHRGPVLAVAVAGGDTGDTGDSGDTGLCVSAGVDARIRCWRLPPLDSDPYDGYDHGVPTSVTFVPTQPSHLVAGFRSGATVLYDLEATKATLVAPNG